MKILYRQQKNITSSNAPFFDLGIKDCYLKQILIEKEPVKAAKKLHYHTSFEIHIVLNGCQEYEILSNSYKVCKGNFILISPLVKHRLINSLPNTIKYSITFSAGEKLLKKLSSPCSCLFFKTPPILLENIDFIVSEYKNQKEISPLLIGNRVFEMLVYFLRTLGLKEQEAEKNLSDEDFRLSLVKQYIEDNIEQSLSVSDLARYCHLSKKQLGRIFFEFEGLSPNAYVQNRRISHIEKLLADKTLSLKEISERLNFNNEYYFNSFFKKHIGMPPGEYRKTFI